ncbi:hypothetical protein MPSEU_001034200 [Mayamaea pseudoterrestris]|nr:hypothetical protein MPSEU_001034200 [Mayamaea pseudoterrestris]
MSNSLNVLAIVLFWFLSVTSLISGICGFLLKLPKFYFPECYMVNGVPGTGDTDFEKIATFVFACVYIAPIGGLVYAYFAHGAVSEAMMSASIAPLLYHAMSFFGIYFVFGRYLNPEFTSMHGAAAVHAVYAILFGVLFWAASSNETNEVFTTSSKTD